MLILLWLFFLHFLADFVLQSRKMGRNKSSDPIWLLKHIGIIFAVFLIGTFNLKFATYNALIHAVIDAFIWKGYALTVWKRRRSLLKPWYMEYDNPKNTHRKQEVKQALKREFKYWEDHWFYLTIGLDQFLHAATIFLILNYLA